ncbi:RNA-directed DNA polymerase, eukaryota, partial [Tanacetum coccineum]
GLGSKAKKEWIRELNIKYKITFLSLQETKIDNILAMDVKFLWGNSHFEHLFSEALGNSSGILCTWDPNVFHKKHHIISDNFVSLYGTWISNKVELLMISVYAPQSVANKRVLWTYLSSLIDRWKGESIVLGDFNEVRRMEERWGSSFDMYGARAFNNFISNSGHFSDHRPILLREVITNYGATPFRLYHSWFSLHGFDLLVTHTWNSTVLNDNNGMIRLKKKLQILKKEIRVWVADQKKNQLGRVNDLKSKLSDIDKTLDQGGMNDDLLLSRMEYMKQLHDVKTADARDSMQKAKIQWGVEGDENSKFFHGIINRKRANLAVKGIMIDGEWVDEPNRVKDEFRNHFAARFQDPGLCHGKINFNFPTRLNLEQATGLESPITRDEIRTAVWGCGENKSPGPDGFTFEFLRKFWDVVGSDLCTAVEWFFDHASFSVGCNSAFIALIPKSLDPKTVSDYRPISLIGSLYKVVTKILAMRLSTVISDLISDVQTAFLPNRQILDGPFIINELLARCHQKNQRAMVFKVDFAKAYDSIRWDYLEDVLKSFGFGPKWCSWIRGSLNSGMASILVNGSPTSEFHFHRGLKQGDPLAPYLFILIMESLHLSFSRVIDVGIFNGIRIDSSFMLSHLFYADDAVFIGEWSQGNLKGIIHILRCFSLLSGLSINLRKSHLLGVGIPSSCVHEAATSIGCSVMQAPFKYLGVMVGGNMSLVKAWDDTINKLKVRLSRWKLKTLSIGGRLTLLKSVLGSTPIYNMSLYKVPKAVLNSMEAIRRDFFNGIPDGERKIAWVKWTKVLASKNQGGLGVSSFYALNRALLVKWVWRFLSGDNSLWARVIYAMHGSNRQVLSASHSSSWSSIIRETNTLKAQGVDLISHCKIRVGNGRRTSFWNDLWIGDASLRFMFSRLYALDTNKVCTVADKINAPLTSSFCRTVRGGAESQQLAYIFDLLGSVILSNMEDKWVWDLNGDGEFRVKDVHTLLDETFLPKADIPTRWIKTIPIKVNIFAWKASLVRLPTRYNLNRRGVEVSSLSCPICNSTHEDTDHLLFCCGLATDVMRLVCRWWNVLWIPVNSYQEWIAWFKSLRMSSSSKGVLKGVFYTA